jgi:hypothetical protein
MDYLEDTKIHGRIILKCIPQIGFLWLRVRKDDGLS